MRAEPLEPGERAPDFFLPDHREVVISLYDKVKGGPIVVAFLPNAPAEQAAFVGSAAEFRRAEAHLFLATAGPPAGLAGDAATVGDAARLVADSDGAVAERYGAKGRTMAFVLDPNARVRRVFDAADGPLAPRALAAAQALTPLPATTLGLHPPILIVPYALEPEFCRYLIEQYERRGHEESGTFRMADGKMVKAPNYGVKRRRDHHVVDKDLLEAIADRFSRRIAPEIQRAFHARIAWVEEFKIVCYESEPGGYFHIHRDNTTPQTAHRRFAMTLVLNAEEFEGGLLRFPEFGNAQYRPETGSAVIFSCSLLHEATPIVRGRRFVLLSFMSDEAGRQQFQRYAEAMRKRRGAAPPG